MQLSELREYASRRGWSITTEYVDQGVSGSKESRPELNQLMSDAHRRRFDAVLVWKIDRFGRSLKHLVNALADLCAYGVAFISFRDNLDLNTPFWPADVPNNWRHGGVRACSYTGTGQGGTT
jgi:DNA invertase Pin-like site-specific DNA recombinase